MRERLVQRMRQNRIGKIRMGTPPDCTESGQEGHFLYGEPRFCPLKFLFFGR